MKIEQQKMSTKISSVYYFTNFHLFSSYDTDLLCNYKYFIQNIIMKLGQDWRIQSGLLAQQIVSIRNNQHQSKNASDFNIFNQFLSAFLKQKMGKQSQFANFSESQVQQNFLQTVRTQFPEQKINNSLTFKTLSLGYCIMASQVWNKTFKTFIHKEDKKISSLTHFGKLTVKQIQLIQKKPDCKSNFETSTIRRKLQNIDIISSHFSFSEADIQSQKKSHKQSNNNQWTQFRQDQFSDYQIKQIKATINKMQHKIIKAQTLSYFVCYVDQMHLKNRKKVRIFSLSNQFYLNAFIVWLIFNVKTFFCLAFCDYLRFFSKFIGESWKQQNQRPLKKFHLILDREWNKLLKDYTVALHDDIQVLRILVQRVRKQIFNEWNLRISELKQNFILEKNYN